MPMTLSRRTLVFAGAALAVPGLLRAQHHGHHQGQFERLNQPGRVDLPELHASQAVTDSPAPRAPTPGQWRVRAPLSIPRTEMAWAVAYRNRMHLVGGYAQQRVDRPCHHAYDPTSDRYERRQPLPLARDLTGIVVVGEAIHVLGGRVDSFHTNSNLHHSYDARTDRWTFRTPLPTARSGHGCVLYRGKVFVMGGEGTNRVYGQNEAWDPVADRWEAHAPMLTPRHGMGAVVLGDAIYVAGGGPQMGGGVKSAINEAFTLG
jgi:Kelch motif